MFHGTPIWLPGYCSWKVILVVSYGIHYTANNWTKYNSYFSMTHTKAAYSSENSIKFYAKTPPNNVTSFIRWFSIKPRISATCSIGRGHIEYQPVSTWKYTANYRENTAFGIIVGRSLGVNYMHVCFARYFSNHSEGSWESTVNKNEIWKYL